MVDLTRATIFVTVAGSRAHGTARAGSDLDLRGVAIAPLAERLSLAPRFEQHEGPVPPGLAEALAPAIARHPAASLPAGKVECVVFDLQKIVSLAVAANPNALELLFADERDWLHAAPPWLRLHGIRHHFLTRKVARAFVRYAMAQLSRIETHRGWLLSPPARRPERQDFGLPPVGVLSRDDQNRIEEAIADKLRSYGPADVELSKASRLELEAKLRGFLAEWLSVGEAALDERMRAVATAALGLPAEVVAGLNAERRYRAQAMKHWSAYETWRRERNPARAELERRFGYDTKHAMHLVRLLRSGIEALETGALRVRRDDAEELARIRDGAWTYERLLDEARALEGRLADAEARSPLPPDVDRAAIDLVVVALLTA